MSEALVKPLFKPHPWRTAFSARRLAAADCNERKPPVLPPPTTRDAKRAALLEAVKQAGDEGIQLEQLCERANVTIFEAAEFIIALNNTADFIARDIWVDLIFDSGTGVPYAILKEGDDE